MNNEIKLAIIRTLPFLIAICVVAVLTQRQKIKSKDLNINKPISSRSYLIWTTGFLIYTLLTEFFLYSLNILKVSHWNHPLSPSVILIFGATILAPIAEELIFRGFILNLLIKKKLNIHLLF